MTTLTGVGAALTDLDLSVELRIGGQARPAAAGASFDVLEPATGRTVASVADAGPEDGLRFEDDRPQLFT